MNRILISALLAATCGIAQAKLPVPVLDDAAKAKAAEAAAKTAWQGKVDAFQLCRSQDKVAAHYRKTAASLAAAAAARGEQPRPAASAATVAGAAVPAAPAASAAKVAVSSAPAASAGAGTATVVAGPPTPTPCADPGPFAYTPPEQKPLEAAGAHSPAGNATSPPNTTTPAAATGGKKS